MVNKKRPQLLIEELEVRWLRKVLKIKDMKPPGEKRIWSCGERVSQVALSSEEILLFSGPTRPTSTQGI